MPKYDCVSIGSATLDLILKSKDFKIVKSDAFKTGTAICEMFGSKVNVDEFFSGSGGGATNTSCALSNFGLSTSCVSVVGMDSFSEVIIDDLKEHKVSISNLSFEKNESTAFSVVLTAQGGGRTVLAYRSACSGINKQTLQKKNLDTNWAYVTNLGGDFKNAKEIILFLKEKGIKIMWNPGLNELKDVEVDFLKNIDVFNLNLEEAATLCNKKMNDVKEIIKYFAVDVGAKISLITMGEKGAVCLSVNGIYHVSSKKVAIKNTIGAGDAFGSGFLYGVIKNLGVEKSLEYAIKNSLSVIQTTGAKRGFIKDTKGARTPPIKKLR